MDYFPFTPTQTKLLKKMQVYFYHLNGSGSKFVFNTIPSPNGLNRESSLRDILVRIDSLLFVATGLGNYSSVEREYMNIMRQAYLLLRDEKI